MKKTNSIVLGHAFHVKAEGQGILQNSEWSYPYTPVHYVHTEIECECRQLSLQLWRKPCWRRVLIVPVLLSPVCDVALRQDEPGNEPGIALTGQRIISHGRPWSRINSHLWRRQMTAGNRLEWSAVHIDAIAVPIILIATRHQWLISCCWVSTHVKASGLGLKCEGFSTGCHLRKSRTCTPSYLTTAQKVFKPAFLVARCGRYVFFVLSGRSRCGVLQRFLVFCRCATYSHPPLEEMTSRWCCEFWLAVLVSRISLSRLSLEVLSCTLKILLWRRGSEHRINPRSDKNSFKDGNFDFLWLQLE